MFQQLLEHIYKDSPHLHRNEIMTLERVFYLNSCLTRNKQIFSTREIIKYSHRYVTLVTEEHAIMLKVVDHSNDKVEKRLATLQEISSDESQEEDVRRLATLKLADANRRLQRFQKAKSIYETLFGKNEASSDKAEVIWGLAKCYLRLDLEEKVISFANQLKETDQTTKQFTANELYADVFLRKAKSKLGNERPFPSDNLFLFKSVYVHLKQAIKMGSLEASYLFLSLVETIKEHFFSLEFGFPEILGHIKLLCGTSYKGTIVHTHFNITLDDGSEVLHDETTTKSSIMKKLLKILKYEYTNDAENLSTELYKQLEKLREQRLEFEIHLLESKEREWDEPCRRSLIDIVPTLRDLLDHSVSFYMKTVLSYSPEKSIFPVKFDKKAGQVDRNVARKKLQTWIKETFQKYPGKPPEEVIQTILEVQPMYDSENYWLAALHELNNNLKHNTKSYANETFELRVDKPGASLTMKSEDIVRKSCQEVERIVSYFLSK
ncbi:hypothetical protein HOLleu_23238 [Holothuria leucospilota]|uniref:Uncharacterized protein n=1 Tax=Holothuria leucospilota TaxID=206669 RepID=A0A9Q1H2S0_HOLLE|nr:hypothetical protein HOLleu_23238 [Holothuria leucospilota]